jgi:hypothetical protein
MNILVLACELPQGFSDMHQKLLGSHTCDLTEDDLKQLAVPTKDSDTIVERTQLTTSPLKDDLKQLAVPTKDSDTIVKRTQLTTSPLKEGLKMADYSVNHFFGVDHFMDRCLKFSTTQRLHGNIERFTKTRTRSQSNWTSPLFSLSPLFPLCMPMSCDNPVKF